MAFGAKRGQVLNAILLPTDWIDAMMGLKIVGAITDAAPEAIPCFTLTAEESKLSASDILFVTHSRKFPPIPTVELRLG